MLNDSSPPDTQLKTNPTNPHRSNVDSRPSVTLLDHDLLRAGRKAVLCTGPCAFDVLANSRSSSGPLTSLLTKMVLMELVYGDDHTGLEAEITKWIAPLCYQASSAWWNCIYVPQRKANHHNSVRGGLLHNSSRPLRDHHTSLLLLNWWVLFQITHMEMLFVFTSSSESLCPPFSHWEITLFSIPAHHKIRAWLHSMFLIPNCLLT